MSDKPFFHFVVKVGNQNYLHMNSKECRAGGSRLNATQWSESYYASFVADQFPGSKVMRRTIIEEEV